MTKTERIAVLEAKVAALEKRVTETEAAAFRRFVQPVNPWWPGYWYGGVYSGMNATVPCGTNTGVLTTGTSGDSISWSTTTAVSQ